MQEFFNGSNLNLKLIGRKLDGGTEGDVFCYSKNNIIKYTSTPRISKTKLLKIIKYIKLIDNDHIVKIKEYGFVSNKKWWIVEERLNPLSEYQIKWLEKLSNTYYGAKTGSLKPNEKLPKYIDKFWREIRNLPIKLDDFIPSNVMITNNKILKLIDIEGISLRKDKTKNLKW